ncbi:MAG: FKBP-type peptidyl-prolyl cis-trans isomerase [Bacteroidota bacterium]
MKRIVLFVVIALTAGLTNCSTDAVVCVKNVDQAKLDAVPKTQLANDLIRISAYLAANNITGVTEDVSGLRYTITTLGTGQTPCLSSTVVVNYSGKVLLANNAQLASSTFDSNVGASFGLSGLITGWQVAFPKFPPGTSAVLYVPSGLAYGTGSPSTKVPANSVLVFNVDLISFQ